MSTVKVFFHSCIGFQRRMWLAIVSYLATALLLGSMIWLLYDVFKTGLDGFSFDFLWQAPGHAGRSGGIFPILASTTYIVAVCLAIAIPLALATAIYLHQGPDRATRVVQKVLDVLAGVPSIVYGLFGNAFFTLVLGLGFSILSGGLTLACMVLPTVIRTIQIGFESIPQDIYKAALATGMSKRAIMMRIFLPASVPSILLGSVLGVARALAETAALLFTSGYVDRLPESIMDSGRALSVHIYELAMNVPGGNTNAYASALVLILLLFVINSMAIGIGHWWIHKKRKPAMNTSQTIFSIRQLSLSFAGKAVFKDFSFDISQHQVTAVVGPSGCGKSSFLTCLNRMIELEPHAHLSGQILFDGQCVTSYPVNQLRQRVAIVYQKPTPFPFSIEKNFQIPLEEIGWRKKDQWHGKMQEVLQLVGLWDEVKERLHTPASKLSGGQQQRLCIARALALEPEVLLMDEPCSALDPISSQVIEELIQNLGRMVTIVIVTHNLAQAKRISQRMAFFWWCHGAGCLREEGGYGANFFRATLCRDEELHPK